MEHVVEVKVLHPPGYVQGQLDTQGPGEIHRGVVKEVL